MRQFFNAWHTRLLSGFLACGLAMPAFAQQRRDEADSREDRRTQQERQSGDRFQQERQQRDQEVRLRPAGWITIGVDSNQDGRFDAVERIYAFDLETAREQSRQRQERAGRSDDQWVEVRPGETAKEKDRLRGSVLRTRSAQFRGHDGSFLVAELRTEAGERRLVNLGPKEKFSEVDFADTGDLQVLGQKGTINGEEALIAEQVRVGGQMINVKPDERRDPQWRDQQRERETRDRRLRDGRVRDRGERDGRLRDREERDGRLLDRGERERRLGDRDEREDRRRDRGEREGRLRDREREGRLLDRDDRDDRRFERGERERRILNRGARETSDRDDQEDDDRGDDDRGDDDRGDDDHGDDDRGDDDRGDDDREGDDREGDGDGR